MTEFNKKDFFGDIVNHRMSIISDDGNGNRTKPEEMCATKGGQMQIRLAVSDFTAILGEIKKLK